MKTLEMSFDTDCSRCAKALKLMEHLEKKTFKKYYGAKNLTTGTLLRGFVLRPDFNASGYLTHWHVELAKKARAAR